MIAHLPLAGVRVLEISEGYAAGLAGRMLRGYGADVVRVASQSSDALTDDQHTYVHLGKRSVGIEALDQQLLDADIVMSDVQPALLHSLGIDWVAIRSARPGLVVVSVTPFGLTGPYADLAHTNAVAFALGGIMGLTGDPDRTPLLTGGSQAYALAGMNAFSAALTLWYAHIRNGSGELADISGQECAAGMLEYYGPVAAYEGTLVPRLGNHTRATWGIYPCLDGWAGVFALARQVPALFALLDDPDLDSERFRDPLQRALPENDEELTAKLFVWFCDKTKADLRAISLATRVPIGTATTPLELLAAAGPNARGAYDRMTVDDAVVTMPGRPIAGFGWVPSYESVPTTQHTVGAGAGATRLPFDGLRVIDLTMMWAGPFATLRMAEMGADVIKIESPSAWDNIRTLIPQPDVEAPWNSAFYFNAYNRDKRSLTLDLAQPAGRALLLRLVATADVLIENYRADVLDKLGLPVEVLHAANPRLIVVSMAAFGKTGPDRDYVGFGPVIELSAGLASLTGYGDGEPFKTGISYGDPVAGTAAVGAVALALLERERTRAGRHVDLAQLETAIVLAGEAFVAASRGEEPVHRGCRDGRFAPQGCYHCLGVDRWLVLSVRNDGEWHALCDLLGLADDLRQLDSRARRLRHDEIDAVINAWTTDRDALDAMESLQQAGIPAGRVHDTLTLLDDPQLVERGFWVSLPHPKMRPYPQQGAVWRLHDVPPQPRRHSPLFGEHNDEILRGELGLTGPEIATLESAQVIATEPINPGVG